MRYWKPRCPLKGHKCKGQVLIGGSLLAVPVVVPPFTVAAWAVVPPQDEADGMEDVERERPRDACDERCQQGGYERHPHRVRDPACYRRLELESKGRPQDAKRCLLGITMLRSRCNQHLDHVATTLAVADCIASPLRRPSQALPWLYGQLPHV